MAKWIRAKEDTGIERISLVVRKEADPDVYDWLVGLPFGGASENIREAIRFYIQAGQPATMPPPVQVHAPQKIAEQPVRSAQSAPPSPPEQNESQRGHLQSSGQTSGKPDHGIGAGWPEYQENQTAPDGSEASIIRKTSTEHPENEAQTSLPDGLHRQEIPVTRPSGRSFDNAFGEPIPKPEPSFDQPEIDHESLEVMRSFSDRF